MTEISKRAHVSLCTVSRYFNHPETVRPGIAMRIQKVVEELNYRPRAVRPGPKDKSRLGIRTGRITFLTLFDHAPKSVKNIALIPELIEAIQSELRSRNLSLAVDTLTASGQFPDCASPKNCDGIIYHSAPQDPEIIKRFWKFRPKVPSVWTFRDHIDSGNLLDHIFYNNAMVGEIAAKYLFSRNCRNVVLFNACPEHTAYKERKATFFASCIKLGMHVTELAPRNSRKNVSEIYNELAGRYVREVGNCDGAFFCADRDMLGLYVALLRLHCDPETMVMIGCNNDQHLLQYFHTKPATIDLKMEQLAGFAVEQLIRRINGENEEPPREIIIRPELVE